jgi:hypothetical protein
VYNVIYEAQQFVSSLCFSQTRSPRLIWSENMDRVTIDGEILVLSKLRSGIQDLLYETRQLLDRLTGGQRFATKLPDNFIDNLTSMERGYSWLSHGPFTDHQHAYLRFLIHHSEWDLAFLDDAGVIAWNIAAVHEYMNLCAQLNANFMFLNFIITDNRGSQMADQQIANGLQPRSLYRPLKDLFWLQRRTKTSNLKGADACIPSFIPPALVDLMTEYLAGGIRGAEELFAHVLHTPEEADLYRT